MLLHAFPSAMSVSSLRPGLIKGMIWKDIVMICLSYTSTEEITDLYQNFYLFLARIRYKVIEQEIYCFNMQI
jgi:hypothetical protein